MSKLQDNCKHEELAKDSNFVWCAYCGKTMLRSFFEQVNYDD